MCGFMLPKIVSFKCTVQIIQQGKVSQRWKYLIKIRVKFLKYYTIRIASDVTPKGSLLILLKIFPHGTPINKTICDSPLTRRWNPFCWQNEQQWVDTNNRVGLSANSRGFYSLRWRSQVRDSGIMRNHTDAASLGVRVRI